MITLDKRALPKEITQHDAIGMAGEYSYWFCDTCKKWRTTKIKPDGVISCPKCGSGPDWKKHKPTLAYASRHKRVADLCAPGAEFRKKYEDAERRYADYIDLTYAGMPAAARNAGWRYFQGVWREADELADYILVAQDAPKMDTPYAYTANGLRRRYYDPRRSTSIISLSNLTDNDGVRFTYDSAEAASYAAGYRRQFSDEQIGVIEYLGDISDPLERAIAHDLSEGYTKRDIERRYGLSERRVRTIVSHIAKSLNRV